jgi:hypothetical protein
VKFYSENVVTLTLFVKRQALDGRMAVSSLLPDIIVVLVITLQSSFCASIRKMLDIRPW